MTQFCIYFQDDIQDGGNNIAIIHVIDLYHAKGVYPNAN